MTRGLVIIKRGKKYLAVRYKNSDSYPSGEIGEMLVKALKAESDKETADIIRRYISDGLKDESELSSGYFNELFNRGEQVYNQKLGGDQFYNDYAYVYDIKSNTLKIYCFGELSYTFKKKDVQYLELIVEHDQELWFALSYNEKKKGHDNNAQDVKLFKKYIREGKSPAEILNIVNNITSNIHYTIDNYKIMDCWGEGSYQKCVKFYPSKRELTFIFSQDRYNHKWSVYIKLPWGRHQFVSDCGSETAALRKLISCLDRKWESLQAGIPLYDLYAECEWELGEYYDSVDKETVLHEEFLARTKEIADKFYTKLKTTMQDVDFSGYQGCLDIGKTKAKTNAWISNAYNTLPYKERKNA